MKKNQIKGQRQHYKPSNVIEITKTYTLFLGYPLATGTNKNYELQGILFNNGSCMIGIDAWRMLDKHDCCSHPLMKFTSTIEVEKEFTIQWQKIKKVIEKVNIPKKEVKACF